MHYRVAIAAKLMVLRLWGSQHSRLGTFNAIRWSQLSSHDLVTAFAVDFGCVCGIRCSFIDCVGKECYFPRMIRFYLSVDCFRKGLAFA